MVMVRITVNTFSIALHLGSKVLWASCVLRIVTHLMVKNDDLGCTSLLLHEILDLLVIDRGNHLCIIFVKVLGGEARSLVHELK